MQYPGEEDISLVQQSYSSFSHHSRVCDGRKGEFSGFVCAWLLRLPKEILARSDFCDHEDPVCATTKRFH